MLNKIHKLNQNIESGKIDFSPLFKDLFTKRLGSIQSYTDRGETYLYEGYQANPVVFAIIKLTAMLAGRAKWKICGPDGSDYSMPELETLMLRPTPDKSWRDYIQDIVTQKMYSGNAFTAVSRYPVNEGPKFLRNLPKELFMLPSNEIQIWLKDGGDFDQYVLDFQGSHRSPDRGVVAADVGHWKTPNPDYSIEGDFLWGQSPLRAAIRALQIYNETLDAGLWYIANKGIESILVNKDADLELGSDVVANLKSKLRLEGQGIENTGNIPIVDANLDVLNVGATPEDIKLLPLRLQAAQEICSVYNFPSLLIGLNDATYQNAKEAKKGLWENVVTPELDEIKDGLNRFLVPMYGSGFYLDYDLGHIDALQEDRLMRGQAIKEFAGMISINEARTFAGLPDVDTLGDFKGTDMYVGFTQAVFGKGDPDAKANHTPTGTEDGGKKESK